MSGSLRLVKNVPLPPGRSGDFDHADVDPLTGRVFVAHTAFGTADVIDSDRLEAMTAIDGCPEGSGLISAGSERRIFAASRGNGSVVHIDPDSLAVVGETHVGPKPNGLAWDSSRGRLLVADVDAADQSARILRPSDPSTMRRAELPGRPRWCVFDEATDRFLVNIREPASVVCLDAASGEIVDSWPVSSAGPHGLDIDRDGRRAYVACDGGKVVVLDVDSGRELTSIEISGVPDATWFDPQTKRLYVGVADPGLLDVVDVENGRLEESIPTGRGAKTSAFDSQRRRLYVFLPESCSAAVFEV